MPPFVEPARPASRCSASSSSTGTIRASWLPACSSDKPGKNNCAKLATQLVVFLPCGCSGGWLDEALF